MKEKKGMNPLFIHFRMDSRFFSFTVNFCILNEASHAKLTFPLSLSFSKNREIQTIFIVLFFFLQDIS